VEQRGKELKSNRRRGMTGGVAKPTACATWVGFLGRREGMIKFVCSCSCGATLVVADDEAGMLMRCPHSGAQIRVPATSHSSLLPAPESTAEAWELIRALTGFSHDRWRAEGLLTLPPMGWISLHVHTLLGEVRSKASARKLRLFACACCRQAWDQLKFEA